MNKCPLCLRRHYRDGMYCSDACFNRAAVPKTNDLMVTAGRARLGKSRAKRGVQQSGEMLFGRNAAVLEKKDE